jgi:hypothetical protein
MMSLDVVAFGSVKWMAAKWDEATHDVESGAYLLAYTPEGLPDRLAPLRPGVYEGMGERLEFSTRATPYNRWRAWLCRMALGVEPEAVWRRRWFWQRSIRGLLVELINYSDAEGTFGSVACAKLAADFVAHRERAEREATQGGEEAEYFREMYRDWASAFQIGAGGGCVTLR